MPNVRKFTALVVMLALVPVVATGATGQAATDPEPAKWDPQALEVQKTTAVSSVPREIGGSFALFRDNPADVVPAPARAAIASQQYGRNAALARSISTPYGTGYVVPGDGWMCVAVPLAATEVEGMSVGCTPTAVAIRQGLWVRLTSPDGSKALETVVVPDGTTAVQSGDRKLVPSSDGVVSEVIDGHSAEPRLVR